MTHLSPLFAILPLAIGTAGAAQVPPPIVHVAPPQHFLTVPTPPGWTPPVPTVLSWQADTATCNGITQTPVRAPMVYPLIGARPLHIAPPGPITIVFAIDASGRPHAIGKGGEGYAYGTSDLVPSLAVARFAPGTDRTGCTIRFTATQQPVATAPAETVVAATIFPEGRPPRAAFARGFTPDTDCMTPPPEARLRAFPAFKTIPQPPGTSDWTMVGHDIDSGGRPVAVRTRYSSGNVALDRAGVAAVAKSRFEPGARKGCAFPYWRHGAALPAPDMPGSASQRSAESDCPVDLAWITKPVLRYPTPFQRRRVEGWAVIAFDVAPWGQTGNVRVLAAEPAAAFGDAGVDVIRQATMAKGQGYVGCVDRVRYVMGKPDAEAE